MKNIPLSSFSMWVTEYELFFIEAEQTVYVVHSQCHALVEEFRRLQGQSARASITSSSVSLSNGRPSKPPAI